MLYLLLSWRNIWRNKRRTLITMASVFFAILLAIMMRSASDGVYDNMIHNLVSFSSGYIQVHKKGYWEDQSLENAFQSEPMLFEKLQETGLNSIVPRLETFCLISSNDKTRGVAVVGIIPELEKKITGIDKKLISGVYPDSITNGVIIGKGLSELLQVKTGDSLVLIGQGYHANTAAALLPIVAIVSLGSPQLDENLIYIPLKQCRIIFSADQLITSLSIMIPASEKPEPYVKAIAASIDTSIYEVMDWKEMMPELYQFIEADSAGNVITIFILYLVISFGLFGTMLMMTKERMHEFGILIAIGMKKRILASVVVVEIIMISLSGALAGILGSIPVVWYFRVNPIRFSGQLEEVYKRYGIEPIVLFSNAPDIFLTQALVIFCFTIVLAIYPFIKIIRLEPLNAINS